MDTTLSLSEPDPKFAVAVAPDPETPVEVIVTIGTLV